MTEKTDFTFNRRMRFRRQELGLMLRHCADHLGLSLVDYGCIERGKRQPTDGEAVAIADMLQTTVDWLTGREGPPPHQQPAALTVLPALAPDPLVIEYLEKMLELAKSGEIRSIAGFYEVSGTKIVAYSFGLHTNKFEAIGHLEAMKFEFLSRLGSEDI